jgi:hypothetical protein
MTIPSLGRGGLPVYSPTSSTATATNGSRVVTFTGTALSSVNSTTGATEYAAGVGDAFVVQGIGVRFIESVDSPTQITLCDPWGAATQTGVANWYIIRNSVPAYGATAKAIQDVLAIGGDTSPNTSYTVDDGTARVKLRDNAGNPQIATGPTGALDAALHGAIQITEAAAANGLPAGSVQFPLGVKEYVVGFRNRLINGNFDIWSKGTSFTSVGAITLADQWRFQTTSTGAAPTVSKVAAPTGFVGANAMNIAANTVQAAGLLDVWQRVEGQFLKDIDGSAAVLSFDVIATTTAGSLSGSVFVLANTALDNGTYSSTLISTAFTVPVGSSRIKIPMSSAQTAGIKNGAQFLLRITQNTATGNVNVSYGAVQFEKGAVANDFEFRPYQTEQLLCLRYLWVLAPPPGGTLAMLGIGQATSATQVFVSIRSPIPMRASPTITIVQPTNFQAVGSTGSSNAATSVAAGAISEPAQVELILTVASGLTAGAASICFLNSGSAQMIASAEL